MVEVVRTDEFDEWITKLKDRSGQDGDVLVVLLCGGDKSTQQQDIDQAHRLANEWRTDTKEASNEQQE